MLVRKNLDTKGLMKGVIKEELIRNTWHHVYREHFLKRASKVGCNF